MIHRGLDVLVLSITGNCNMRCPQCAYVHTGPREMPLEVFTRILEESRDIGVKTLRFLGLSEPTLHTELLKILAMAAETPLRTHLFTNGTTLGVKRVREALLRFPPDLLEVSIDALNPKTFKLIRGGSQQLLAKINNATESLGEAIREGRSRQAWGRRTPMMRVSFVTHPESASEVEDFKSHWIEKVDEVRFRGAHNFSGRARGLGSQRVEMLVRDYGCGFLQSRMYVDAYGLIHACTMDFDNDFVLGNVACGDSLQAAWSSGKRGELCRAHLGLATLPGSCHGCSRCPDLL